MHKECGADRSSGVASETLDLGLVHSDKIQLNILHYITLNILHYITHFIMFREPEKQQQCFAQP